MGDAAAIEVTTCNVRQKSDSNYCCSVSAEPLELGGVGRAFLDFDRSSWAEGPGYGHHISTSPLGFSDLPTALLSRAHIPNAESAPLTKRTKNQHATVGYNPNRTD